MRAKMAASSGVLPLAFQSVQESRTDIGRSAARPRAWRGRLREGTARPGMVAAIFVIAAIGQRREKTRQQVAVRAMQFEPVGAGCRRELRGAHEIVAHAIHVGAAHRPRDLAVRQVRIGRSGDERPCALGQRLVHAFPGDARRALAPGMSELDREFGLRGRVDEIDDAPSILLPAPRSRGRGNRA